MPPLARSLAALASADDVLSPVAPPVAPITLVGAHRRIHVTRSLRAPAPNGRGSEPMRL
jgi:hypothetical protein